jgi:hypothetical protein
MAHAAKALAAAAEKTERVLLEKVSQMVNSRFDKLEQLFTKDLEKVQ